MIKINLLPVNITKKETIKETKLFPIFFLVILVVLVFHIAIGLLGLYKKMQFSTLEAKWNQMHPQFKEVNDLKSNLAVKKDKVRVMEYVLKRDVYWTDFLNKINQAAPKGLWLNRLTLSEQGLIIEGSVFSFSSDEVTLLNKFFNQLKEDDYFKKNFHDFSLDSVQRRTVKQYEIVDFLLTAEINKERFEVEYSSKR